jgi:cyclopropane-fatty-acyl-phospholipid synthase
VTIEIAETDSTAIDSDRWPDVARIPRGRLGAVIADWLIRRAAARLPVRLA